MVLELGFENAWSCWPGGKYEGHGVWPPRGDDGAGGVLAESKQGRGSSLRLGLRHSGGAGEGASPVRTSLYIFSLETLSPPLRWLPGLAPAPASRRSANPGGGPRCSGPGGGGDSREGGRRVTSRPPESGCRMQRPRYGVGGASWGGAWAQAVHGLCKGPVARKQLHSPFSHPPGPSGTPSPLVLSFIL